MKVGEDLCISDAEISPRETRRASNTRDAADSLPSCPMPTEVERTPPSLSSHPSNTQSKTHADNGYIVSVTHVRLLKRNRRCRTCASCVLTDAPPEPCWYCLRSLDSEYRPESPQQVSTFMTHYFTRYTEKWKLLDLSSPTRAVKTVCKITLASKKCNRFLRIRKQLEG